SQIIISESQIIVEGFRLIFNTKQDDPILKMFLPNSMRAVSSVAVVTQCLEVDMGMEQPLLTTSQVSWNIEYSEKGRCITKDLKKVCLLMIWKSLVKHI